MKIVIELEGLDRLNGLSAQASKAIEKALDEQAGVVQRMKIQVMDETYTRDITISATGKPKWERSGDWLKGQQVEDRGGGVRAIVTRGRAEKYERRLANLPDGPDGINRTNAASQRATEITEPQVQAVFEQALRNAMRL